MANVKLPELPALTSPSPSDLVPVADVSTANDEVKKTSVGEIVGIITGDVEVATDGTATISELPVSKLQDGAPRQLLQTDAAGTGVEWTDDVDLPGTLDVAGLAGFAGGIDVDSGLFKAVSTTNAIGFYGATPVTQASAIADITTTATTGSLPTSDGSVTIADAAAPTVTELLEYCVELESKLEAALTALRNLGLIAN